MDSDQQHHRSYTVPQELSKKFVQSFPPSNNTANNNNSNNNNSSSSSSNNAKRLSADTAAAVSEVIRLFVVEAHARASIEAECDKEGTLDNSDKEGGILEEEEEEEVGSDNKHSHKDNSKNCWAPIRAEHITKVAAGLIMDFS